jgi:transketolase
MTTIKGPIHMTGGFNIGEFLAKQTDGKKVKLPFEATGWESTKMPEGVDMTGIELKIKQAEVIPKKVTKEAKK